MVARFKPKLDQESLVSAIKQCTSLQDLKTIHGYIVRNSLTQQTLIISKLIESASLRLPGQISYAHQLFSWTHKPNLFMWNTIIRGYSLTDKQPIKSIILYQYMHSNNISSNSYTHAFVLKSCCKLRRLREGRQVHAQILKSGLESETHTVNGVLNLYVTCGFIDFARWVFDEMPARDVASWSVVISGYAQCGHAMEVMELFREMIREGIEIDGFTLASVAGVCGDVGALDLGKWVHSYMVRECIKVDVVLGTSLVSMYSKCGSLDDALDVFNSMHKKDVTAWSTMIGAFAIHGYGTRALDMFSRMKKANLRPNSITFVSVLSACSHAGLVDEGVRNFNSMSSEYGVVPGIEHYGCMVDLLCRAGLVNRAYELIHREMPIKPNVVMWRTLLNSCKIWGHKELAERVSKFVIEVEPENAENYVLVSNVYASLGKWSSVSQIRGLMNDMKAKKGYGWSSIEVNFVVHWFVMGDESHPESKDIYRMLDEVSMKLKGKGYVATTIDVLHDIDEEEKEHALGLHSERLAIAYGLLHMSKELPIRIVKNLRICRDCHSTINLISKVYEREIIVRDRVRFHHFRKGKCSCNDYW